MIQSNVITFQCNEILNIGKKIVLIKNNLHTLNNYFYNNL